MIGEVRCRQSVALAVLALVAGADPAPAQMGGTDGRIVTVAVPLPAASGSYRVEVKPGVRLVGPAAGQATDSVLPLSFVLPATAASGLQTLADVVVGGRRLAVTTRVAVRHALALRAAAPGVVRAEAGDTIWLVVENRGNVPETVALRSGTPPRGFRIELGRSTAHLPVGGRTEVPVVMREVGTGEASLRVSASAGPASAHAQLRIAAAARRPRGVPVSVTVLAPHDRGQQPVVVATGQAWLGDSVLVRASYGTRDVFWSWFPGLLGSRQRILELRAPRWSLSAGDITLPGSTGMVPWLSGFGARASLGQRLGWSGHAALVRETHASASSAAVTAAWRAARLGVHATVVARTAEDRPLSRLWVLGGDWANGGARWIGELGSANVGAGEVAVGAFDLTYAGARGMVRGSAVRQAEMAGPIGLVKMRADGGAEVRVLDGLTYFGRAAASRSSWPGGDEGEQGWAVSTEALGGARARVGRALVTTSMRRTCFASSRPPSVSYAAMEAAVSSVVSIGPRMSIRPEAALRRSDATGRWRPRAGAAFAWSANDAFLSLAGEWGQPRSGYAAPDEAPGWNASAQMWARHGTGSGDLVVTLTRTQDGRVVGHGTASLAWRVLPRAELLAAIRNLPRVPAAPGGGWSVSLGLRTDFSLAWNAPSPSGLVFEDLNRNGQRDRGDHPIAGVPLQWGLVERVSDAHGRFKLPDERVGESAWPESDSGWQVIAAEGNRVAVARAGGCALTAPFHPYL